MYKKLIIATLLLQILLLGCQTTTRFGDILVPAHPDSEIKEGEKIKFILIKKYISKDKDKEEDEKVKNKLNLDFATITMFLADQAKNLIAKEMRNEAKKYLQQYSGKFRYEFKDLNYSSSAKYYLYMIRLVKNENIHENFEKVLKNIIDEKTVFNSNEKQEKNNEDNNEDNILIGKDIINEKMIIASAYKFEISFKIPDPSDQSLSGNLLIPTYGYIDLKKIYMSKAKAKVVGWKRKLNFKAWTWKPLKWLSALFLKTDDKLKVDVHVKVKGLDINGPKVIIDSSFPDNGHEFKLGTTKIKSHENLGDWLLFKSFISSNTTVNIPLTFDIRITERDPSNVQKILIDTAEKVKNSSFKK